MSFTPNLTPLIAFQKVVITDATVWQYWEEALAEYMAFTDQHSVSQDEAILYPLW